MFSCWTIAFLVGDKVRFTVVLTIFAHLVLSLSGEWLLSKCRSYKMYEKCDVLLSTVFVSSDSCNHGEPRSALDADVDRSLWGSFNR